MIDISTGNGLFTLIITIEIPPENHAELLQHFIDTTREHSRQPGFVSCALHSSADRRHLAEYIQWRDRRSWEAVNATGEGREHVERFLPMADVGVYDVVAVHDSIGDSQARMTPRRDAVTTVTVIRHDAQDHAEALATASSIVEEMRSQPGFMAAGIHGGVNADRVAIYGQWADEPTRTDAMSAPDVAALLPSVHAVGTSESRSYGAYFIADGPTS